MLLMLASGPLVVTGGMLRQLVVWLGFFVDRSSWIMRASTDALQAPMPYATKRARVVDVRVRDAVAEAAGSREGGNSSSQVVKHLKRFGIKKLRLKAKSATPFTLERVARYWKKGKEEFGNAKDVVVAIVMDATRAGRKDVLSSALWSDKLNRAMWLPPQAGGR